MIDEKLLDEVIRGLISIRRMRDIVEDVDEDGEDFIEVMCCRMPALTRAIYRDYRARRSTT